MKMQQGELKILGNRR